MTQFFGGLPIRTFGKLAAAMLLIFLFLSSWTLGIAFSIVFLIYNLAEKCGLHFKAAHKTSVF